MYVSVVISILSLHSIFGLCASDKFKDEIANWSHNFAIMIESRLLFSNSSGSFVLPITDYFGVRVSGKADLMIDYQLPTSKVSHRLVGSELFNGGLHSSVGVIDVSWAKFLHIALHHAMPDYLLQHHTCETSVHYLDEVNTPFVESFKLLPNVSRYGDIVPLYSIPKALLQNEYSWDSSPLEQEVDGTPLKVYSGIGDKHNISLGFDAESDCSLADLKWVKLDVLNKWHYAYNVHKLTLTTSDAFRYSGLLQPHDGVLCKYELNDEDMYRKLLVPNSFSLEVQHVNLRTQTETVTKEYFDFERRLVRVDTDNMAGIVPGRVGPASIIIDKDSNLAFIRQLGSCVILNPRILVWPGFLHPDINDVADMPHRSLLDLLKLAGKYSRIGMYFKGICTDSFGVNGKLYTVTAPDWDMMEVCLAENGMPWDLGSGTYSVPLYVRKYSKVKDASSDSLRVSEVSNFLDVQYRPTLVGVFEVGDCFRPKFVDHYVFLGQLNSTHAENYGMLSGWSGMLEVCASYVIDGERGSQDNPKLCLNISSGTLNLTTVLNQRERCDQKFLPHVLSLAVSIMMNVSPIRISNMGISCETNKRSVIGFSLLDFAGLSDPPLNSEKLRSNDAIMQGLSKVLATSEVSIAINWFALETSSKTLVARDEFKIIGDYEVREKQMAYLVGRGELPYQENTTSMVVMLVTSSLLMGSVGVLLGLAVAYKLWRTESSFGYMIHTDIS